jgi:voltage-gated potassium channel Kch
MAKNSASESGHRKAASEFYIKEFIYRRKKNMELFRDSTQDIKTRLEAGGKWFANWLLYETCGYGERLWRIVYISALVVVTWAMMYATITDGTQGPGDLRTSGFDSFSQIFSPEGAEIFGRTLYFSLVTFTTLGYGDVQPVGPVARTLASLESFIGALLVALVVFVIGRRMA